MKNVERKQVTVWFSKKEKTRIRKVTAWLNGRAPDHVRKGLVAPGPRNTDTVSYHSLGYHGIMQLVESCEDMMK